MKKLFFVSLVSLFVLSGCQNDEEKVEGLTSEEAKAVLDGSATSMSNDIISLAESEGVNELIYVVDLLDEYSILSGRAGRKEWTKERIDIIVQHFVDGPAARVGAEGPKTLEDIKGLYVWNAALADFDVSESDFFIVQFPTDGSESNNAEFKISALEFEIIENVNWQITAPKVIDAYLKVDDVTLVELKYDVSWTSDGTPETADVSLLVSPFSFVINFTDTFAQSTSLLTSVSINDELIASIDVDVSYETQSKLDPYLIEGNVQYRGLKIEGNVDAREIGLDGNPNDFVNLILYADNEKVGDIVFVLEEDSEGYQDYVPYVQYPDGSQDKLEDILAPVFEEIERIFADFE